MKKFYFKDGLQIMLAIVLTGTTAFAMSPISMPAEPSHDSPAVVQEAKPVSVPSKEPEAPKTAENKPKKKLTWQDNPNECNQGTHWIAKEEPFKCILKAKTSPTATGVTTKSQPVSAPSGSCESWMQAAGVPITNATKTLIINESGCRPDAVNPTSGACGIPQALPCSKLPCSLQDPVCQLKWMDGYVKDRYTTWEGALSFWHCIGTCYNNYGPTQKVTTWY